MKRRDLALVAVAFLTLAVIGLSAAEVRTGQTLEATAQQATPTADTFDLACSPPPQCFRDRDCDRICGKGNGVCRRVNSCYSECLCSATRESSEV